jgi:hypothetical protein
MNQTTYRVIFTGTAPNVSATQARTSLATLFKTTPEQIDQLLAAPGHVLKPGLSQALADRYCRAIESAGGACLIESESAAPLDVELPARTRSAAVTAIRPTPGARWLSWFNTAMNLVVGLAILIVGWSVIRSFLPDDLLPTHNGSSAAANGTAEWTPPTSGTWTCDNVSNPGPWQVWTLSGDGHYSYRIAGSQLGGTGQYRWNGKESIAVEEAAGGALNQEWMVLETEGRNWLMTNGHFVVYCHR